MKSLFKSVMKRCSVLLIVLLSIYSQPILAQTFIDNLDGEQQGEFPSNWNLIKGSAEVASQEGSSFIYLSNNAVISPKINGEDYLANNFTLEFDAYFDDVSKGPLNQYYQIRFWNGTSYLVLGNDHVNPLTIMCHGSKLDGRIDGSKVTYDGYMQSLKKPLDVWRHVTVNYNNGTLKVKIDDFQSINIPALLFDPEMISIGVFSGTHTDFVRGVKNIRITGIDGSAGTNTDPSNTGISDNNDNPNDTTITYNYTLPIEDGTPNQILETDGNGTVSWVDHDHPHDHPGSSNTGGTTNSTGGEGLKINDLSDGKSDPDGSSVFLGLNTGNSDDGSSNKNVGVGFESLNSNTEGNANIATGYRALFSNTTGSNNIATGYQSLYSNTIGNKNTANGVDALHNNISGHENTAIGYRALYNAIGGNRNTAIGVSALEENTGSYNTSIGYHALFKNTSGLGNTAIGTNALKLNTTGDKNTSTGTNALEFNTTGNENTANGISALHFNTTGRLNTAIGSNALYNNTTGNFNTATGSEALYENTTGGYNTAYGNRALYLNTTGVQNTAIGINTLYKNTSGSLNNAFGDAALYNNTTGNFNTAIGNAALSNITTGNNNIGVGNKAQVPVNTASNQIRIGNTDIHYAGVQVPWHVTSDQIWKEDIRPLPYGLDFVKQLKPVDYIRKNNKTNTREIGFIAQDVEQVLLKTDYEDQGFLTEDDEGRLSLRYNDLIPLLTKAIQEQQIIIEELKSRIEALENKYEQTKID